MREMADALWEGHTLLKTGLSAHRHTQTDRKTKVKTVGYIRQFHSVHVADKTSISAYSANRPSRCTQRRTPNVINRRQSAVVGRC